MQKYVLKNFQNRFYYYNSAIKKLQKKGNVWTVLLPSAFSVDFATSKKTNGKHVSIKLVKSKLYKAYVKNYHLYL